MDLNYNGKIIKGVAGDYEVYVLGKGPYICKAKGIFRYNKQKPLVGDDVLITVLDEKDKEGNILEILPRRNELIRPAVANIDQALIVFAVKSPMPSLKLLDRFLVMMEMTGVKPIICFNKIDLMDGNEDAVYGKIYEKAGYKCIYTSTAKTMGIDVVLAELKGKTTTLAGPSGVGKSSMLNALVPGADSQTGEISKKIERGKQTTRHTELFHVEGDTYIMDTPGFATMYIADCAKEELRYYMPEFDVYEGRCKYNGCVHIKEPGCMIKAAVENGDIDKCRYENYVAMYEEIKNLKKY